MGSIFGQSNVGQELTNDVNFVAPQPNMEKRFKTTIDRGVVGIGPYEPVAFSFNFSFAFSFYTHRKICWKLLLKSEVKTYLPFKYQF